MKTRPRTHRFPPDVPDRLSSSAATQVVAQGSSRCIFFSKPCCQTPQFLQSHLAPARRRLSERSPQVRGCVCVCVARAMMSVKHREHAPSPDWWTRGRKHQHRVMRSMLPFMKSLCLLIVPRAWPASLLLLIPTPQQSHKNRSTIPPLLFSFLLLL